MRRALRLMVWLGLCWMLIGMRYYLWWFIIKIFLPTIHRC